MIIFCYFVWNRNKIEFKFNILIVVEGNRLINFKILILFWKGNKEYIFLFFSLYIFLMLKFVLISVRFWLRSNKLILVSID